MFGCISFFAHGNALVAVWTDRLIARLGADDAEQPLREPYVRPFNITGRPMRNWVAIEAKGLRTDGELNDWIKRALAFVTALQKKTSRATRKGKRK